MTKDDIDAVMRGVHARRHLQRLRRHLRARPTSPRSWPPRPRACSSSGRRSLELDGDTGTGEQPLCFVDQTNHDMRIGWYTDTYRRTADGLAAAHPVDDVPAQERRPRLRARPTTRPAPSRRATAAADRDGARRVPGVARRLARRARRRRWRPTHAGLGTLDEQMAQLAKVKRLTYDAGWMRWGWPERVGGLGGSTLLRGLPRRGADRRATSSSPASTR